MRRVCVVAAVVLVGCRPGVVHQAPPRDPVLPVPTVALGVPASLVPDLKRPPAAIDGAYLQAVLHALDHVAGEAARLVQAAGAVTGDALDLVDHTTAGNAAVVRKQSLSTILRVDPAQQRHPMQDPVTTVERVVAAWPDCVAALVNVDHRGFRPAAIPFRAGVRLRAARPDATRNPTAFALEEEVVVDGPAAEDLVHGLCA